MDMGCVRDRRATAHAMGAGTARAGLVADALGRLQPMMLAGARADRGCLALLWDCATRLTSGGGRGTPRYSPHVCVGAYTKHHVPATPATTCNSTSSQPVS